MIIGFFDYTVILTYLSLASSVIGIFMATEGHLPWALCCLALSGFFDTFDGKVARTKKNRTEEEKNFGIQIDSLCDMICFGVLPVVICYQSGMRHLVSICILVFFSLAGLIRLAYFNVMEMKRQQDDPDSEKVFWGMPITSIAGLLPLLFVISSLFENYFLWILNIAMFVIGLLFILRFRMKKPTNRQIAVMLIIGAAMIIYLLWYFNWIEYANWNLREYLFERFQHLSRFFRRS